MKHLLIAISLLLTSASAGLSAHASEMPQMSNQETAIDGSHYTDLFVSGYVFKVPKGVPADVSKNEVVMKNSDGTFGLSIRMKKNDKASANGAYDICKQAAKELHIEGATVSKVRINGLEGATVEGQIEGMNVAVEVLNLGGRYLQATSIYTDAHAEEAKTILTSVRKE